MKRLLIALLLLPSLAFAGGSNPGWYYGFVPTPAQYNAEWSTKLDYTPGLANQLGYWDGSGNFLNAAVSGDCTSVANVFSCAHVGSVLAGPGAFSTITNSGGYTQTGTVNNTFTGPLSAPSFYNGYISISGASLIGVQGYNLGSTMLFSSAAPTIASGFGTSPSIVNSNGTASFAVNVGTGGTASSGVITLPAAATNWNCVVANSLSGAGTLTEQTAHSSTSVTISNFTIATAVAVGWTAGYVVELNCVAK